MGKQLRQIDRAESGLRTDIVRLLNGLGQKRHDVVGKPPAVISRALGSLQDFAASRVVLVVQQQAKQEEPVGIAEVLAQPVGHLVNDRGPHDLTVGTKQHGHPVSRYRQFRVEKDRTFELTHGRCMVLHRNEEESESIVSIGSIRRGIDGGPVLDIRLRPLLLADLLVTKRLLFQALQPRCGAGGLDRTL